MPPNAPESPPNPLALTEARTRPSQGVSVVPRADSGFSGAEWLRVSGLFAGSGMLDVAACQVLDATVASMALGESPGACRVIRLLVTGSREWVDRTAPRDTLTWVTTRVEPYRIVVVHGAQGTRDHYGRATKGHDLIMDEVASERGIRTEPHPADWDTCAPDCDPQHRKIRRNGSDYCPTAGFRRNQKMVDLGVNLCIGFPLGRSPGTRNCMHKAASQGIPVVDWLRDGQRLLAAARLPHDLVGAR
jgi:hypothetical protein